MVIITSIVVLYEYNIVLGESFKLEVPSGEELPQRVSLLRLYFLLSIFLSGV